MSLTLPARLRTRLSLRSSCASRLGGFGFTVVNIDSNLRDLVRKSCTNSGSGRLGSSFSSFRNFRTLLKTTSSFIAKFPQRSLMTSPRMWFTPGKLVSLRGAPARAHPQVDPHAVGRGPLREYNPLVYGEVHRETHCLRTRNCCLCLVSYRLCGRPAKAKKRNY